MRNLLTITNLLAIISSIIGVLSFFVFPAYFSVIVLVCACLCMLHSVLNVIFGDQNNLTTEITTIIIGVIISLIFHLNMRNTICVSICVAEILFTLFPFLLILFSLAPKKK